MVAIKKITWRWLFNSFGVIVVIILLVIVGFAFGIYHYYHDQVFQLLTTQAEIISSTFDQLYIEDGDFIARVREHVNAFPDKERMELMTIDSSGRIYLTSSGFEPDGPPVMYDFYSAFESGDNIGRYIGPMGDDIVMAVSVLSRNEDPSLEAVRLVVSLRYVHRAIVFWIVLAAVLGLLVLLTVLFSSQYFLGTIVNPVSEASETARKIAAGNFETRLKRRTNDEIGELCDTINHMAEKLGEADRMKNDFISSVSHELRTPLTAIQGWGETILGDAGNDKQMLERGMSIIISETGRLSQMVDELLDFSRSQNGQLQLDFRRIDVLAELSDVVIMYTDRATREGLAINYNDNDLIVPISGDKNKLRQVFVNIVDNAVKYSDPGGVVNVASHIDGGYLKISVSDTGIGISAENLPHVKEKFFKVSSTRRSSGIGLSVADDIILRHGGKLGISSELGKGTTVTIELPILAEKGIH